MKDKVIIKNKTTGQEAVLVRKSTQKPVNIRRVASKPSGRRSA
jgi:hypothetical protein